MGRSTPNPWARGEPSLAKVVKERKDDTAQHRRQTARQVVPKPVASGGATDITRVWAYDLTTSAGPANTTVYPASLAIEQLAGDNTLVSIAGDSISVAAGGIYLAKMDAWLAFSLGDDATQVRFYMDHAGSVYHYPRHTVPVFTDLLNPGGSGPDAVDSWLCGPFPIAAGGSFEFGAIFDGTTSSPEVNYWSVDITKIG